MIVEAVGLVQKNTAKFTFIRRIYNWMDDHKSRVARFGEIGRRTGHQSHLPPLRSLSVGCV